MEDSVASPLQPYGDGDATTNIRMMQHLSYDEKFYLLITCHQASSDHS